MKMDEKDPNLLTIIFNILSPEIRAAIMAIVLAALRIIYDRKEKRWQRIAIECLLCGALSYGISSGLSWFSLPSGVSVFCGSMVGFLGVDFVRSRAIRYVDKKVDDENT